MIVILNIITINNLYSVDFDFRPERMITDFNGVVYNGTNVLAYGDYGIITYSEDRGVTWKQHSIGDSFNIKKVVSKDGVFYGVTKTHLIKSVTDGLTFIEKKFPVGDTLISCAIVNNGLFLLTNSGLYQSDKELNVSSEPLMEFDPADNFNEISSDSDIIYLLNDHDSLDSKHILKYRSENSIFDTIELNIEEQEGYKLNVSDLRIDNEKIYLTLNKYFINFKSSYIYYLKSGDGGSSWVEYLLGHNSKSMQIFQDNLYNIDFGSFIGKNGVLHSNICLYKSLDETGTDGYVKKQYISDTTNLPKRELGVYLNGENFNELVWISKDTLITVGDRKLIAVSTDGGVIWELKSKYYGYVHEEYNNSRIINTPFYLNEEKIYEPVFRIKSTDGGITWLPPLFVPGKNYFAWYNNNNYYLDDEGRGFRLSDNFLFSLSFTTKDFGDTYQEDTISYFRPGEAPFVKAFQAGNKVVLANNKQDGAHIWLIDPGQIQVAKPVYLENTKIHTIHRDENGHLFAVALYYPEGLEADSVYQYRILNSTDNGNSWVVYQDEIGIRQWKSENGKNLDQVKTTHLYKNYILIPSLIRDTRKMYYFDLKLKELDSLELPFTLSLSDELVFGFKGELFAISRDNFIYHTGNFGEEDVFWNSFHISEYLGDWEDYIPGTKEFDKDFIYSAWADDEQIYLMTVKSVPSNSSGILFVPNYIRLYKKDPLSIEETENTETQRAYFYKEDPFPIPAKNIVKTKIYWNSYYKIDNAKLGLYDMFGGEIPNSDITVEPINAYSAYIIWNCLGFNRGVYFIRVSLGGESMTIPVLVGGR
jgi:hypothetical protein